MANLRKSDMARRATTKVASASADQPEFDRDEIVVCMVLAFALGNAMLTIIYRLMS